MEKSKSKETLRKVYLVIESLLCLLVPALLAISALGIYREGKALRDAGDALAWIYTPEKVAERFAPIAPFLFAAILLAIVGVILGVKIRKLGKPAKAAKMSAETVTKKVRHPAVIRIVVAAVAVAMIIAGLLNGSMRETLIKAINICTECIGLG